MSKFVEILQSNPIRALAVAVAAGLGVVGLELDANAVYNVLVVVIPLVAGEIGHSKVSPVRGD